MVLLRIHRLLVCVFGLRDWFGLFYLGCVFLFVSLGTCLWCCVVFLLVTWWGLVCG